MTTVRDELMFVKDRIGTYTHVAHVAMTRYPTMIKQLENQNVYLRAVRSRVLLFSFSFADQQNEVGCQQLPDVRLPYVVRSVETNE